MVRVPTDREPTHPGEMLLEEFLLPLGMTQRDLATAINVPFQRVNEVVRGRRGITPSTALRLSRYFGTTNPAVMRCSRNQLGGDEFANRIASGGCVDPQAP